MPTEEIVYLVEARWRDRMGKWSGWQMISDQNTPLNSVEEARQLVSRYKGWHDFKIYKRVTTHVDTEIEIINEQTK